ncbi:peptidase M48 [Planotetraspora thailandica]|uniref:Peptidase M48 n=1 Tax=Planotetraspora thailandica TaxID=487172 RepID=A0A8J3V7Z9_9ACTN|nr:M48 family metalloprotease [Planotetraspora thailandica]GII56596.1 peptidase M48 [Planotetraspora thailandica]
MTVSVYLPLLVSVVLAVSVRPLAKALPPRLGLWVLTAAAVIAGVGTVWTSLLLGSLLVDDIPAFDAAERLVPVDDMMSLGAAAFLGTGAVRSCLAVRRLLHTRRRLRRLNAMPGGELLVVADPRPDAFAVPGSRAGGGRVVVTQGMLRALDAGQRRALIAHERTHLRARHSIALSLAELAAAMNPLLVPVRRAVGFLSERDADEGAVAVAGSRRLVAEALAAAARARSASAAASPLAPGFHQFGVVDRVSALLAPEPVTRLRHVWIVGAMTLLAVGAAFDATRDFAWIVQILLRH